MTETAFEKDLRVMKRGTALAKLLPILLEKDDRFRRARLLTGTSQALFSSLILATIARTEGRLTLDEVTFDKEEIDHASKYLMAHSIFDYARGP